MESNTQRLIPRIINKLWGLAENPEETVVNGRTWMGAVLVGVFVGPVDGTEEGVFDGKLVGSDVGAVDGPEPDPH